ncbi:MAG: F0F1 ATP synthase subunit A [Elusimicrobia bacterium]|nr:F0F1 ATP synthase subunit A [Elusimicrobiota bacterium]
MNFEAILEHHLLDHAYLPLFKTGGVTLSLTKHLVMMWIVGGIALILLSVAARSRSQAGLLLRTAIEAMVLYIRDTVLRPIFGHATERYLPYFLTLFFFILIANLAGLVPYGSTVTGNISVTFALAGCTFMLIQVAGIREQGLVHYIQHFVPSGLPAWLVPLIALIEIMGLFAKCIALCIRLFANMIAGHIVSLAFLSLIFVFGQMSPYVGLGVAPAAVGLALFVYALDVLVSFLQAYIFTTLTALFVGAAVHPH